MERANNRNRREIVERGKGAEAKECAHGKSVEREIKKQSKRFMKCLIERTDEDPQTHFESGKENKRAKTRKRKYGRKRTRH